MLQSIDLSVLAWLTRWHTPLLDQVMSWLSAAGGGGLIWLALGAFALSVPRYRAAAWRVMLTVMLAYLVVGTLVKPAFARPRPPSEATAAARGLSPVPSSYSFPSAHATATFGAAVAVSRMWPQTRAVWWITAILVAYSRVYLGHHYPLDTVAGAVLGIGLAFWVLGGRHRATYASTLPTPLPPGVIVRP